ncbi:MAG: type II toxin-antitoxin system YoeB family toxin [Bacteroidaceae bacterium]|nr:type II toxin-antitoxin system YoeB family toxin [Bacteroidaceae bacterium]
MEEIQPAPFQEGNQDSARHHGTSLTGLGHPEPLIGGRDVTYSRHITAHDRIIYDIIDDCVTVLIIQAEEHYDDK